MNLPKVIAIDLGATNLRGAVVDANSVSEILSTTIYNKGTFEEVLNQIFQLVEMLLEKEQVTAIGIGVPGLVDVEKGIVYDVLYIPSWIEVPLKQLMESKFKMPVFINNDANCFAAGELYFGKGKSFSSMVGLTIGTGLGAGLIFNNRLFTGVNCGAGEVGMLPYLDHVLEYYASGSFFKNIYDMEGIEVFIKAAKGDAFAINLYKELGHHIGNAIKMIMYAYDPEIIILGGSIRKAYSLFEKTMWESIRTFAYSKSKENIIIKISELENSGILGAAALCYDAQL
ncbi:MAG: ROK family protein [Ginsengibacter sp.]